MSRHAVGCSSIARNILAGSGAKQVHPEWEGSIGQNEEERWNLQTLLELLSSNVCVEMFACRTAELPSVSSRDGRVLLEMRAAW